MTNNWEPNDQKGNEVVTRTVDFIVEEAEELMQELNCPPSYIAAMLRAIAEKFDHSLSNAKS